MGDVVNLRSARKRAERQRKERQAAENRLSFGCPKAARLADDARKRQARRKLDQHRIETGEGR